MRYLTLLVCLVAACSVFAQERGEKIDLWGDHPMPNTKGIEVQDSIANERVYKVGRPAIYRVSPTPEKNRGIAVIICPGGGYQRYAWEVAGWDIARWFADQGVTGFILTARLPNSPDAVDPSTISTQDLQRALQVVRARASEWGIDPAKVGVEGSSAGGHLAATSGVEQQLLYRGTDAVSRERFTADFMILVSPVISMDAEITHMGSREQICGKNPTIDKLWRHSIDCQVTEQSPTTLLIHADNDPAVSPLNSIRMYEALRRHKVPATLHIFPQGGHSIDLGEQPAGTELWKNAVERWFDLLYGAKE
ncbi:MAG: alpha/beta hydrolase [Rikenellaceae bacterium]|nr:alpha/beta hydrolase [Rikenellaceae bacterium]